MIKTENLSFAHKNKIILKPINLEVKKGELLIIIGPNGAGKSTLLQLLANEIPASKGQVCFKQKNMRHWSIKKLALHKAKFSQAHQNDIELCVKDIVMMGRYPYFNSIPHQNDYDIIAEMMRATEIHKYRNRSYNSLSGGEKQRVHLARVLAQLENDKIGKLAFFDEPLNNLDVRHQHRILENIQEFTDRGNTSILVLHDLNLAAEFAHRILLLKDGKVIAHGKPENIFKASLISKAYDFPCAICPNPLTNNPMIIFKKDSCRVPSF